MTQCRACRSCGAAELETVLSLGATPLANALLAPSDLDEPEPTLPARPRLLPRCSLVQITETVPPDELFRDYVYFSSFSDTMVAPRRRARRRARSQSAVSARRASSSRSASNDGYLLQDYREPGHPACSASSRRGTSPRWPRSAASRPSPSSSAPSSPSACARRATRADVIHANNVLAHVADLNGFVAGIATLLADDGVAVIEVPTSRT